MNLGLRAILILAAVISFIIAIVRMFSGGRANVMCATRSVIAN